MIRRSKPSVNELTDHDAGWSSLVAREAHNLEVAGSNPVPATKKNPRVVATRGFFRFRQSSKVALSIHGYITNKYR